MSTSVHRLFIRFALFGAPLGMGMMPPSARAQTSQTAGGDPAGIVDPNTVDSRVPTPEAVLGHRIGDKGVRYEAMVEYLRRLDESSPLVTLTSYAVSHEGRTLYYLTITSEANHAKLAAIKADNAKLADPRKLGAALEGDQIADALPGIAWLAYNIHGDELSSTDAAVAVAYKLAAGTDEATRRLRDELVIHIDPLMNPDGRERYLAQLEHLTGKVPNPDYQAMQHSGLWSVGRGNHYLFDLNRDWLAQVHPETQGRAAVIQSWNPHLVVDSHEMGSLDTYLFDPPREPHNTSLSDKNLEWRRRFSSDQAKAFDRHGWSYYTQEWYEEWYPGYTNAWASLQGAVGLLYEQAGVNAASVRQPTGQELTFREAVHHHVVSSLANLETLRANRRDLVRDFLADQRWAVSGEGPHAATFLLPPSADRAKVDRFVELLGRQGIESQAAAGSFEAQGVTGVWGDRTEVRSFPQGTLMARSAQPRRRLMHAILDFDPRPSEVFLTEERSDLENRRGTRLYDVTAWNLAMAYGLDAYWADRVSAGGGTPSTQPRSAFDGRPALYGYLIDGGDSDVYRLLVRLLDAGCKPRVASKPFTIGGRGYRPGAVLLRRHENPAELAQKLRAAADGLILDVRNVDTALCEKGPDLGGQRFHLLQPPRVAIASQWPAVTTSFGSTWFLLDQRLELRCSPINLQGLGGIDLRKYNVLVLPQVESADSLAGVLDAQAIGVIKSWVEAGGTLVAMGNSAAFVAGKDRGLSAVRLRSDVLDQLAVYAEAVGRERAARQIHIDSAALWGGAPTTAPTSRPSAATSQPAPAGDLEALKRLDAWQRTFSPTGAFAAAELNPDHWLCFGVGDRDRAATVRERLPVQVAGGGALMAMPPAATPVRLAEEARLRLSGLMWPEARQRWADTAYATVESVGQGQIILFATDPFFRGYLEGSGRLLINAILLGPGMGASAPVPW